MTQNHYVGIGFAAGILAGFFLLSGANTYAAGKWGASTLGWVYAQSASIAAPSTPGTGGAIVNTGN